MAKYIANPVEVDDFVIIAISNPLSRIQAPVGAKICLTLDNMEDKYPDDGMLARYSPKVGDYWVIQADGYIYINPKVVFERKYSQVGEFHS